jgi:hypothetical protein
MRLLTKLLWIDTKKQQVCVQSGIRIATLLQALARKHLTLPNQPAIASQTIGGAIATATHGTGKTGTMAEFVESIDIILPDGSHKTVSQTSDPDLFQTALVSFGTIGIMYAVTLTCIPLKTLKYELRTMDIQTCLATYTDYRDYDHMGFFLHPYTNKAFIDTFQRQATYEPLSRMMRMRNWFAHSGSYITEYLTYLMPTLAPFFITRCIALQNDYTQYTPQNRALSAPIGFTFLEEEIAIDASNLNDALQDVLQLINRYPQKEYTIIGIRVRFAEPDTKALLSPAYQRKTAYISMITPVQNRYKDMLAALYNTLKPYHGRPHWAKIHNATYADIQKLYEKELPIYEQIHKRINPCNTFTNTFYSTIFTKN